MQDVIVRGATQDGGAPHFTSLLHFTSSLHFFTSLLHSLLHSLLGGALGEIGGPRAH